MVCVGGGIGGGGSEGALLSEGEGEGGVDVCAYLSVQRRIHQVREHES